MSSARDLSPRERRVLAMRDAGVHDAEIARRFRRSRGYVKRVVRLADARAGGGTGDDGDLTPLERRVLKWRDQGARPQDMAWRFRRSPEHIARVERLARYKLARGKK